MISINKTNVYDFIAIDLRSILYIFELFDIAYATTMV